MHRFSRPILGLLAAGLLAGCGGTTHHSPAPAPAPAHPAVTACTVPVGHGTPGACAPAPIKAAGHVPLFGSPLQTHRSIQIVDLSNNDPIYDMRPLARFGIKGMWLKVQEGTGYRDPTFGAMVNASRRAGIPVGGYDFVRDYNASEAYLFVARLKATGTCTGKNTLPPVLDMEAGSASQRGVQVMVDVVRHACGRVAIYTGLWYWNPALGQWWPHSVSAWISGYPNIVGSANYGHVAVHQFTDRGYNGVFNADLSVWLGSQAAYAAYSSSRPVHHGHSAGYLRRRDQRHLHVLYRTRQQERVVISRHHCRRRHDRRCRVLLRQGDQVNREIKRLRARGIR